jgi:hypothetical protein
VPQVSPEDHAHIAAYDLPHPLGIGR